MKKGNVAAIAAVTLALAGAGVVAAHTAAAATAGCRVTYTVTSQWPGGFGANVDITNLGDAVNGWRLTWTFPSGQSVTQAWNATVTQSGAAATATNMSYNAAIATGATTSFGFNGSWSGSNPAPASFALNGTTCTGSTTSPSPSRSSSPSPSVLPTPSASGSSPAGRRVCDIYAAGGTPCIGAHSTTRALFGASSGPLYQTTTFSGPLPNGYSPMKTDSSLLLGTGGDNSNTGVGEFFEGAITSGYPSDATENAVQADVTAAAYR